MRMERTPSRLKKELEQRGIAKATKRLKEALAPALRQVFKEEIETLGIIPKPKDLEMEITIKKTNSDYTVTVRITNITY